MALRDGWNRVRRFWCLPIYLLRALFHVASLYVRRDWVPLNFQWSLLLGIGVMTVFIICDKRSRRLRLCELQVAHRVDQASPGGAAAVSAERTVSVLVRSLQLCGLSVTYSAKIVARPFPVQESARYRRHLGVRDLVSEPHGSNPTERLC